MTSEFSLNAQFHSAFRQASSFLEQQDYTAAIVLLKQAHSYSAKLLDYSLFAENAKQNIVTVGLIQMGLTFRLRRFAEALTTYNQLFDFITDWQKQPHLSEEKHQRYKDFQKLAESACRHLHLQRLDAANQEHQRHESHQFR